MKIIIEIFYIITILSITPAVFTFDIIASSINEIIK